MDTQPPEGPAPFLVEILQSAGDLSNGWSQPRQQATPRVGQRDAPRRAMQQANAEALLKVPNRVAERRGCDSNPRSRSPEAEFVSYGDECHQIRKIAAMHS